jgi:hypothetical protein
LEYLLCKIVHERSKLYIVKGFYVTTNLIDLPSFIKTLSNEEITIFKSFILMFEANENFLKELSSAIR